MYVFIHQTLEKKEEEVSSDEEEGEKKKTEEEEAEGEEEYDEEEFEEVRFLLALICRWGLHLMCSYSESFFVSHVI